MRILHVIPSLAPCHGGPSVVLPLMERALAAEGLEVDTVTTDDEGPGLRNGKGDGQARPENGVVRRYFRKQTEFYKVSLPLRSWMLCEVKAYDLVHIHALFSHSSIAAARAAKRAGVPYVIRPLGVLNRYGMTQRRAFLKQCSLRWVEAPLLRGAAAVHFTHRAEAEEAGMLGIPFRSVVIPLGLEIAVPAEEGNKGTSVLYLSRIDPKKNLEVLLDAWAGVARHHPDWHLSVAGSGDPDYLATLRRRCEELGVNSSVEWLGQVEGEAKAALLNGHSIYVLPSHSENFGIAAAEALAAGKACVFTAGVAIGADAAAQGAAILSTGEASSLESALRNLIADPAMRSVLSVRAREFAAAELSARTMGRRLKSLYEEVVGGTP